MLIAESGIVATLEESLGHGHTVRLDVQDEGRPASAGSILQATSDLIRANPEAPITVLDHSALQVSSSVYDIIVLASSNCIVKKCAS